MHSSQRAVWRKRGANCKLERLVQISPALAKPPSRWLQCRERSRQSIAQLKEQLEKKWERDLYRKRKNDIHI
jgi:hypothetical protein